MDGVATSLRAQADDLYARQQYEEAIALYKQALVAEPNSYALSKSLGMALATVKRFDEAVEACQKAALMQPADGEIRYGLGYALAGAGRLDEAIKELDGVLYLQPNHVQAKQMTVYCLMQRGRRDLESNPMSAEQDLDRAHKLDPRNPEVTAALLQAMVDANQRGKVVNFLQAMDGTMKSHAAVAPIISKIENDCNYEVALKHASMRQAPASIATPAKPAANIDQVPCPQCKLPVMSYAAICPHCSFKIKQFGTFATHDTGPAHEWQEIAYLIVAILWTLGAGLQLFLAFQTRGFLRDFFLTYSSVQLILGLGLIFRQGTLMFLARIFCFLAIIVSAWQTLVAMMLGQVVLGLIQLVILGLAAFMAYLIGYVGD